MWEQRPAAWKQCSCERFHLISLRLMQLQRNDTSFLSTQTLPNLTSERARQQLDRTVPVKGDLRMRNQQTRSLTTCSSYVGRSGSVEQESLFLSLRVATLGSVSCPQS